jgi:hypothetical protein
MPTNKRLTDEYAESINQRYYKAIDELEDLCCGKNRVTSRKTMGHEWRMSIPADRRNDSDLIIGESLHDIYALLSDREAMAAENEALREAVKALADFDLYIDRVDEWACHHCAGESRNSNSDNFEHAADCPLSSPIVRQVAGR